MVPGKRSAVRTRRQYALRTFQKSLKTCSALDSMKGTVRGVIGTWEEKHNMQQLFSNHLTRKKFLFQIHPHSVHSITRKGAKDCYRTSYCDPVASYPDVCLQIIQQTGMKTGVARYKAMVSPDLLHQSSYPSKTP